MIGVLWEWIECYGPACYINKLVNSFNTSRSTELIKVGCSGIYDIVANVAGVSIAIWVLSEFELQNNKQD